MKNSPPQTGVGGSPCAMANEPLALPPATNDSTENVPTEENGPVYWNGKSDQARRPALIIDYEPKAQK